MEEEVVTVEEDGGSGSDEEESEEEVSIKDPRAHRATGHSVSDQDIQGHRAHNVYVAVHVYRDESRGGQGHHHYRPRRRSHHRRHSKKHNRQSSSGDDCDDNDNDNDNDGEAKEESTTHAHRNVTFSLGDEEIEREAVAGAEVGVGHGNEAESGLPEVRHSHPLFSEMEELVQHGDDVEWMETARWVRFEESVEECGHRWSKPHVATLSLHALFELRSLLLNNTAIFDMEAQTLDQIADLLLDSMVTQGHLPETSRETVRAALLRPHRHLHDKDKKKHSDPHPPATSSTSHSTTAAAMSKLPLLRSLSDIGKKHSSTIHRLQLGSSSSPQVKSYFESGLDSCPEGVDAPPTHGHDGNGGSHSGTNLVGEGHASKKHASHFMRKIPMGAEASSILVGEVDILEKSLSAFVRLSEAILLGDLTEVPVPTRFVFVLLGRKGGLSYFHEVGRSMATLMSDDDFHDVAYKAKNIEEIVAGVDEFLDAVTVLPPGEWDPSIRIEPPAAIPSHEARKQADQQQTKGVKREEMDVDEFKLREAAGLVRTGRLFGGIINDIKRKRPWYLSEFKDAMNLQCVASWLFMYFASLTPVVTFGGLLEQVTHRQMAAIESLVAGCLCGVVSGIFSGQPLILLGSTGVILVFETIVVEISSYFNLDYMEFRVWIGIWTGSILFILAALDASVFASYITRFTEENFAALIAFIFIVEAVKNLLAIKEHFPINPRTDTTQDYACSCQPGNSSVENVRWSELKFEECTLPQYGGQLVGGGCGYYPDVFVMSVILFAGTFIISVTLKDFKTSPFFPTTVRRVIADFAVIIAIVSMTCLDMSFGLRTPKLLAPDKFQTTIPSRGWFIPPFGHNPLWSIFAAVLPASFASILIFMDQLITAVIINRKEHLLKKGGGYHLDMAIAAVLIVISSFAGLPWFVAATILSMNHVNSLKIESECAAPGEKPRFLGLREQRATHISIFVMIGLSVSLTPVLKNIPMPVLYGVFLFMGFSSLRTMQLFQRIQILFMPTKYQPDYAFLRQVPISRVHLFTLIQVSCLIVLWLIKSFKVTSILFPLMLVVMTAIRKLLDNVFSQEEAKILDTLLPDGSSKRRGKNDKEEEDEAKIAIITKC